MNFLRDFYQKLSQNNWCDQVSQKNDPPPPKKKIIM